MRLRQSDSNESENLLKLRVLASIPETYFSHDHQFVRLPARASSGSTTCDWAVRPAKRRVMHQPYHKCYNCSYDGGPTLVLGSRGIAELMYIPEEHDGEFGLQTDTAAERFWSGLPFVVPKDDGWVLRISYGNWIKHGPDSAHYHAHLYIEPPTLSAFASALRLLRLTDDATMRKLPTTYPGDRVCDATEFILCFVPELKGKSFLEVASKSGFAWKWCDTLYALGITLNYLGSGTGDGAALCIHHPWQSSLYTLRCEGNRDAPLRHFELRAKQLLEVQWH